MKTNIHSPAILPVPLPHGDRIRATPPEEPARSSGAFPDTRSPLTEQHLTGGDGAGSAERHERPFLIRHRIFQALFTAVFWLIWGAGFWTTLSVIWEVLP